MNVLHFMGCYATCISWHTNSRCSLLYSVKFTLSNDRYYSGVRLRTSYLLSTSRVEDFQTVLGWKWTQAEVDSQTCKCQQALPLPKFNLSQDKCGGFWHQITDTWCKCLLLGLNFNTKFLGYYLLHMRSGQVYLSLSLLIKYTQKF